MSRFDASANLGTLVLSGQPSGLDDQNRIPFPSKKGAVPESPSPRNLDPNPMKDRMMDRMRKVDPKQSERYRQRTGE